MRLSKDVARNCNLLSLFILLLAVLLFDHLHILYLWVVAYIYSGIEIWRIENFKPVTIPKESHGKFFTGDSYIVLKVGIVFRSLYHFLLIINSV